MDNNNEEISSNDDIEAETSPTSYFDAVIGHIEDIILSPEFQRLHDEFFEKHWRSIENTEENKHQYMEIYQEYTETFENFFVTQLSQRMKNFDMKNFADLLEKNDAFHDTANYSEIFELLHSFSDFQVFKELILDYRSKKEGNFQHLEFDILVTKPLSCVNVLHTVETIDSNTEGSESSTNNLFSSPNEIDITDQLIGTNDI